MTTLSTRLIQNKTSRKIYRVGLLVVTTILVFAALVLPIALRPESLPMKLGDVATQSIVAPSAVTFESKVLTEQAQESAANAVSARYLPMDTSITRAQIDKLQSILNYISLIRTDTFASPDQKINDLKNIGQLAISEEIANSLLNLSDSDWQVISQEAISTLEQTMRKTIRDYQIQESQLDLPSLISYSLPDEQVRVIESLVSPLIVANSLYSEEETNLARQKAIDEVKPVTRTFAQNQMIVTRGQIINAEQYEVLELFGLIKPENKVQDLIAASSIVLVLVTFIVLYFSRRTIAQIGDLKSLTVIAVGFLVFLYGARFLIPNRAVIPYFFPISAYALILVTLFNLEIGIVFSLSLSILAAFDLSNSLVLTVFYMLTSLIAVLSLGNGRRISNFFLSAVTIGLSGSAVLLAYKLTDPLSDWVGMITLISVTFLNGFASASLALLVQYPVSQLLGFITPFYLTDISRPDHPLLKNLLQNAPGTYQHSLQVSNIAEQAAEAIGADPMLTRVGTLYHDIGKTKNPSFFIENQVPGKINSHDDMDPVIAAQTIIHHVEDGVEIANHYRLPPRILDFIREHHGTQITRYQYNRAMENVNNDCSKVDIDLFRYSGPKPRSKETALVMLADSCEAKARAELPKTEEELSTLVKKIFSYCLQEGQLDKTNLTIKDLSIAQVSFIKTLANTYHPRIQYPEPLHPSVQENILETSAIDIREKK